MFAEVMDKPVGVIRLIEHTGTPNFIPWGNDERFGVLDLSGVKITKEWEQKNLIVNSGAVLQAQRMAPGNLGTAGIGYLAAGSGVGTGTTSAPQAEDATLTTLRSEQFRKAITSWTYLDANGNATGTATNVVQFTTTFLASEANFTITELGLFGGTATTTANSGTMFNMKVFSGVPKTAGLNASLTIVWTITF